MTQRILLAGGAEFGGQMAKVDQQAIQQAGGNNAPILIIPTAAAPDNNHRRAGSNGERWFRSLGATDVTVVPLIDTQSANDPIIANQLRSAKLIYLLGGFTHYLGQTLKGSQSWQAALEAHSNGALLAGSSAGAMALCEHYVNPSKSSLEDGLNLVANCVVLPHHNTFGQRWAADLLRRHPTKTLLGIDERTGMIGEENGRFQIHGAGNITIYHGGSKTTHPAGTTLTLPTDRR